MAKSWPSLKHDDTIPTPLDDRFKEWEQQCEKQLYDAFFDVSRRQIAAHLQNKMSNRLRLLGQMAEYCVCERKIDVRSLFVLAIQTSTSSSSGLRLMRLKFTTMM